MFDSTKKFQISTIDGKQCVVAFPSDQQWADRTRKNKTIRRDLGRGKSQYEAANAKRIDAELFLAIRQDADGAEFDEAEASFVIDRLDAARVVDVAREGNQYRITLRVPGATVVHVLRVPSQKQAEEYGASSGSTIYGERQAEIRVFLEPAGKLYDAICSPAEGYAESVPIIHKLAAVNAMLRDINMRLEEDDPEE